MRAFATALLCLAFASPAQAFPSQTATYVGPGDVATATVVIEQRTGEHVGGATFFHLPAGTTRLHVEVVDDSWGDADFIVCQDLDHDATCRPSSADVYKEACGSVDVAGIHDTLLVRVFVVHSWASIGVGQCPGGIVGVTTGTITLTPA